MLPKYGGKRTLPNSFYDASITVTECKSVHQHTVKTNNTKTLESEAKRGWLQGHAKRRVAQAFKKLWTPQRHSAKASYRQGEGGVCLVVAKFLVSDLLFLQLFPWVRSWSGHNVPATASSAGLSHQQRVSLTHGQTQHHHLCQSAGLPVRAPTLLPETAQTHLSKKLCVQLWVCLMLLQPSLPVPLLSALLGRPCFATAPGKGTSKQTGGQVLQTATQENCYCWDHCHTGQRPCSCPTPITLPWHQN